MHIFFIDLKISIDMYAPVIFSLIKNNEKVTVINLNLIQEYNEKNNKILSFLSKNKNFNLIKNNQIKNFKFLFFKKFFSLFKILSKKKYNSKYRLWKFLWLGVFYLSPNFIKKISQINQAKTFTILEDLPPKKKTFIKFLSEDLKIPIIMMHGGINTLPSMANFLEIIPDYYLAANNLGKQNINKLDSFKHLGSPRYAMWWITTLEKIYKIKSKKNKSFRIGIFIDQNSKLKKEGINKIINELKNNGYNILINSKPREIIPLEFSYQINEISSSELIFNSDVIISYPSSILLEVIQRDKPILFPKFLDRFDELNKGNVFENNEMFYFPLSMKNLMSTIEDLKSKKIRHKYDAENKKNFLKLMIEGNSHKSTGNNYLDFYSSFK